jgi:hypothetical protein
MPFGKLFWIPLAISIALLAMLVAGFNVLPILVAAVLVDIIIIELSRQEETRLKDKTGNELASKLGNVENICQSIATMMKAVPDTQQMISTVDQRVEQHKQGLKEEFKDSLDRIATKAIQIENGLTQLKKTMGAAVAVFDERIKAIENSIEEEPAEIQIA